MDGIEYLGLLASSLATLAFLPQVVKTWRTRSAQDFSLATLVMLETGTAVWIVYGLLRGAPAIWLGNGVTLMLAGFILLVKLQTGAAGSSAGPAHEAGGPRRPLRPRQRLSLGKVTPIQDQEDLHSQARRRRHREERPSGSKPEAT